MRIGCLAAVHDRPCLAAAMLRHTAEVLEPWCGDAGPGLVVATADGPDLDRTRHCASAAGWAWAEAPNRPLSWKWQVGLSRLLIESPDLDAILILGSDDFVSPGYLRSATRALASGMGAIGPAAIWMLDAPTCRLGLWRGDSRLPVAGRRTDRASPDTATAGGAGRIVSTDALRKAAGVLWPEAAESGLDGLATQRLADAGVEIVPLGNDPVAEPIVDVKGTGNLHAWETLAPGFSWLMDALPARRLMVEAGLPHPGHLAAAASADGPFRARWTRRLGRWVRGLVRRALAA